MSLVANLATKGVQTAWRAGIGRGLVAARRGFVADFATKPSCMLAYCRKGFLNSTLVWSLWSHFQV